MNPDYILLRFGEFTLKKKNRFRFENTVIQNLKDVLKPYTNIRFTKSYGRIYIELNGESYDDIAVHIRTVFGIRSFSPVRKSSNDEDMICQTALETMVKLGASSSSQTFKVSVKRAWKEFPKDSQEMNYVVGSHILRNIPNLKVDVHHPEIELRVEIREECTYIYSEVVQAVGGFPHGSNGKAMLMLSGGIDSPVAGWLSMRKGLDIEAVHFHSFPFTSERAQQKVMDLAFQLAAYTRKVRVHMVPFTDIQMKLNEHAQANLLITFMRRAMFRITEQLAHQNKAMAIVTGESLGQVASQTLSSMNTIGSVVNLPVLRPLITMDKDDIIRMAEQIGTYEISILPFEDCCTLFLPKSPSTNPNIRVVERMERQMSWLEEEIQKAIEGTVTTLVSQRFTVEQPEVDSFF